MKSIDPQAVIQTEDKTIATRVLENGTKILMHFGDVIVPGTLNDSEMAKALIQMLPCTVSATRYDFDICGVLDLSLPYDNADGHRGWLNGDIDYATNGGWFTIMFSNEENSGNFGQHINLGKVDCPLAVIRDLNGSYRILIELAE